jgi:hypothetical protein
MAVSREVTQGPQVQGVDEQIVYTITTTNWASSPSTPSLVVKDMSDGARDVSATVVSGSTTASGDVITCGTIKSLIEGHEYRAEVKFTVGSNIYETYFIIKAEL